MDFTSKNRGNGSNVTCLDTKKASILLIRKIYVLMQNLGPLPEDVCLTMKLFYYDEVTPPNYQPPGFKEGDCEGMAFEGEPMHLNVGAVPTPFHMLRVKVTTEKERMEHIDQTILKRDSAAATPFKAHGLDEKEAQKTDEDFTAETKMKEQENTHTALPVGELNLACEEDENTRTEEYQALSVSSSQVEHLAHKASELELTQGMTRSGKRFQQDTGAPEGGSRKQVAAKCPPGAQKRSRSELGKPVYNFEFSSSQESGPKRRKFSEPKERY